MEPEDNICVVCSDDMSILAIGVCDHPICYKCSTRMRVLCMEKYCPTCRSDLPQVVLVKNLQKFEDIKYKDLMYANEKYRMLFESSDVAKKFNHLISHFCPLCDEAGPEGFPKFSLLRTHVRHEHKLFYCELCAKNLKIFTFERKLYNQHELGRHRNEGDPDDTSYRGHPMCQFCRQRYLDIDELYRHLRKDHLFCHFCDVDGYANQYYNNYDVLKEHFRQKHFLCEDPECAQAQFTHAFRTDIDLKMHISQEHSQSFTKAQARQARTIEVDFQLAPRVRGRDVTGGQTNYRNDHSRGRMSKNQRGRMYYEEKDAELKRAIQASLEDMPKRQSPIMESDGARGGRDEKQDKNKEENVPTTPKLNLTDDFPSLIPVTSEMNTFQTQWTSRANSNLMLNRNEEFPTLSSLSIQPSVPTHLSSSTKKQGSKKKSEANQHKPTPPLVSFEEDFPQLAAPKRRPNSSNVSIVVSNAWSNNKQSNQQQQQQPQQQQSVKIQSQKKPQPRQQQHQQLITNSKLLSKVSVGYNPPLDTPALITPNITTMTIVDNKAAETPVITLKDVSKILDTEENFPSLSCKASKKNTTSVKMTANWPVKKSVPKTMPEENKKSVTMDGCIVLKGKKHKEKLNDNHHQNNKKENSCPNSNKTSLSADCSVKELATNARPQNNEKPIKKEISEIKVDLQKKTKNAEKNVKQFSTELVMSENEFPKLGKQEKPSLPPGIKVSKVKPPPGFSGLVGNHNLKNHRTPPGLTLPSSPMKNMFNQNLPSASVQEGQTTFPYCPPSNFDKRNKTLICEIRDALSNDESRFGTFKSLSKDFRQGIVSSREYYRQCSDLLGPEKFPEILIELISLLPDIEKQQALLMAYRDSSLLQVSINPKTTWRPVDKTFFSCPICKQVLIKADYNAHLSLSHPNNDFPLESTDSWSSGKFQEATWIKAK